MVGRDRILKGVLVHRLNSILDSLLKPVMGVYVKLSTLTLCSVAVQLNVSRTA